MNVKNTFEKKEKRKRKKENDFERKKRKEIDPHEEIAKIRSRSGLDEAGFRNEG